MLTQWLTWNVGQQWSTGVQVRYPKVSALWDQKQHPVLILKIKYPNSWYPKTWICLTKPPSPPRIYPIESLESQVMDFKFNHQCIKSREKMAGTTPNYPKKFHSCRQAAASAAKHLGVATQHRSAGEINGSRNARNVGKLRARSHQISGISAKHLVNTEYPNEVHFTQQGPTCCSNGAGSFRPSLPFGSFEVSYIGGTPNHPFQCRICPL